MSNYPISVTKFQIMELLEPVGLCTDTSTPLGGLCSGFKFPKTLCPAGKKKWNNCRRNVTYSATSRFPTILTIP